MNPEFNASSNISLFVYNLFDELSKLYFTGDVDASEPEDAPDLCQVTMDAVMMDGHTYIFKGALFYSLLVSRQPHKA